MDPLIVFVIEAALLLLTAGAMVGALVQARVAQHARQDALDAQIASEDARDEALRLARKATDAFERSAAAQERANEIEESKLPKDGVRWQLVAQGGNRYLMRNVGTRLAEGATLHEMQEPSGWLRFQPKAPVDVKPGGFIDFRILVASGTPNIDLEVRWHEGDGPIQQDGVTIPT
jgi:hypothetical protein